MTPSPAVSQALTNGDSTRTVWSMTRAEFIQQAALSLVRTGSTQEHAIDEAVRLAGKLQATDKAPWSDPSESVLLKRIEDEAHRRGYLLGLADSEKKDVYRVAPDLEQDALLAVEKAARDLRESVGYESGATSHDLDAALTRLDKLREPMPAEDTDP